MDQCHAIPILLRSRFDGGSVRRSAYNRSRHFHPRACRCANSVADATLAMEMKRLTGGNLRSAGYDDKNRMLVVELSSGTFQYTGVTAETWRRFASASSPWSFFRDNIDEEYPAKRIR
jgi:hypothetical protein